MQQPEQERCADQGGDYANGDTDGAGNGIGKEQEERAADCGEWQHGTRVGANGKTGKSASMRSSTPPWPGSRTPLSLTPAARLNKDSSKSPTTPKVVRKITETVKNMGLTLPKRLNKLPPGVIPATSSARQVKAMHKTPTMAPATPSHVLPGLMLGASFCLKNRPPRARPEK